MNIRHTHTVATLDVSAATYDEIARRLRAAAYNHLFLDDGTIDMSGIGLVRIASTEEAKDQEPMNRVLDVLNTAFAADPAAIHALCANRVPCNRALADHPTVIVGAAPLSGRASYDVGALGLINGLVDAVLRCRVAMAWSDGEPPKQFLGFVEYTAPADADEASDTPATSTTMNPT